MYTGYGCFIMQKIPGIRSLCHVLLGFFMVNIYKKVLFKSFLILMYCYLEEGTRKVWMLFPAIYLYTVLSTFTEFY